MITAELGFTQMPAADQGLPGTPWRDSRGLEAERRLSRAYASILGGTTQGGA